MKLVVILFTSLSLIQVFSLSGRIIILLSYLTNERVKNVQLN